MRWSYKIVHYDYKKEGILGGTFLDEAEIEQSMNEIGKKGWELVSLMEVQDGLTATFKRPEESPVPVARQVEARAAARPVPASGQFLRPETIQRPAPPPEEIVEKDMPDTVPEEVVPEYRLPPRPPRPVPAREENPRRKVEDDKSGGVGSIRIE
jgi:hypothetical protein